MSDIIVGKDVPQAYGVSVGRCQDPRCTAVHIVLDNEQGEFIASAALSPKQVEQIVLAGGWALVPLN
jgi:hypothetical protein